MGFVQKFADVVLCPFERSALRDVGEFLSAIGWDQGQHSTSYEVEYTPYVVPGQQVRSVSFGSSFRIRDRFTASVPSAWPEVGHFLSEKVGYSFPFLCLLRGPRAIRNIATCIAENLDVSRSCMAPPTKLLCGFVFAKMAHSNVLLEDLKHCARHLAPHILGSTTRSVLQFADEEINFQAASLRLSETMLKAVGVDLTLADRRALLFAKAISSTPSIALPLVVGGMDKHFSPQAVTEQVAWIALLQTLHRLYGFFANPKLARREPAKDDGTLSIGSVLDDEIEKDLPNDLFDRVPSSLLVSGTKSLGRSAWRLMKSSHWRLPAESPSYPKTESGYFFRGNGRYSREYRTKGRNPEEPLALTGHGVSRPRTVSSSVAERHSALDFLETIPSWSDDKRLGDDTPWDANSRWLDRNVHHIEPGSAFGRHDVESDRGGGSVRLSLEFEREREDDLPYLSEDDEGLYRFLQETSDQGNDSSRGHSQGSIDGLAKARRAARVQRQRDRLDFG
jgi:hypothetical protein